MPPISRFFPLLLVALAVAPVQAQKPPKQDRFKIAAEELAAYAHQPLSEVIQKARPHFLMFNAGSTQGMGEATMSGEPARLLVYIGTQAQGDSTILRMIRASEVREIRFYRPGEAMSRLGASNAFVIQVVSKGKQQR